MKIACSLTLVVVSSAFVLGGCNTDAVTSVTTAGTGASAASSSGEAGKGGEAGAGGTVSTGGAGGTGGMGGSGGMVSTGGMGGMGGAAPTCVKPGDMCAGCLYEQCQLAYCDCAGEPKCFGIIGCIQACPPNMPDCINGCYATNAPGFAEFVIVSSCAATLCAPSCPGSDQVKPCDLCLSQKCEGQLETCLANAQCFPLIDCRTKCMGNMMCEKQCDVMFPQGVPAVQALFGCAAVGCTNSCN